MLRSSFIHGQPSEAAICQCLAIEMCAGQVILGLKPCYNASDISSADDSCNGS